MKKSLIVLVSLVLVFSANCHTQRVMLVKDAKLGTPTYEKMQTFWFFGLIGKPSINASDVCGGKTPVAVVTEATFVDGLINAFIGFIWSPATVKVYCQ